MKFLIIKLLVLFFTVSSIFGNTYVIKLSDNVKDNSIQSDLNFEKVFDFNINNKSNQINSNSVSLLESLDKYYTVELSDKEYNELRSSEDFASITPNYKYYIEQSNIPNDPKFNEQWNIPAVDALKAWNLATGEGITIGVVDTGIDNDHEDLKGQLWINSEEDLNGNGTFEPWPHDEQRNGIYGDLDFKDNDGNGYVDDVIGYDFVDIKVRNVGDDKDPDPFPFDEHSHGTYVSGIIAAKQNNDLGISGIAYNSKIMTLRAFDIGGAGESDDIAAAIVYAVMNGVDVLNFSFGENYYSPIVHDAIRFAHANNVFIAASSGNNNWYEEHFPSDLPEVTSVGAIANNFEKSANSNYGNRIDILAPGSKVPTLNLGNSYTEQSGTSMAAPHVSAAAAMLLEISPNLTPEEIKFKLQKSAVDDNENRGWDIFYGAGILNIDRALRSNDIGEVSIQYPEHNSAVNIDEMDEIPIVGNIIHPLLRSYQVFIRKSRNPFTEDNFRSNEPVTEWISVSDRLYDIVKNDTIFSIDSEMFEDTVYTIRIVLDLMNNTQFEHRFYIRAFSNSFASGNSFTATLKPTDIYIADKRGLILTAQTKFASEFYVDFYDSDDNYVNTITEIDRADRDHSILVTDETIEPEKDYRAVATAVTMGKDTITSTRFIRLGSDNISTSAFVSKPYSLGHLYLNNELYDEEQKSFAASELDIVNFGLTSMYKFDEDNFQKTDSIPESRIIIGYGDSKNNGNREILTTGDGEIHLYEESSNSAFGNVIYSKTIGNAWATEFIDIDNDGHDEIIARDDSSFFIIKYTNGEYNRIASTNLEPQFAIFNNFVSSVTDDFDNDGINEIVFTNTYGMIFIYEFKNGQLERDYVNLKANSTESSQHLAKGDIDADGIPEVVILNAGFQIPYNDASGKEAVWTASILRHQENEFQVETLDLYHGVRIGPINKNLSSPKNGVAFGNLDNVEGDEVVISVFPDVYVYTYRNDELKPYWYYGNAISNTALIYDFDENGKNELGISTFSGTRFFEMTDNEFVINAPANFNGRPVNENTVKLHWDKVENADTYQVFRLLDPNSGQGVLYSETRDTSIVIDTLDNYNWYDFFIVSKTANGVQSNTASNLVSCFTHPVIKPLNIEQHSNRRIKIKYSGKVPEYYIEPHRVSLSSNGNKYTPNSILTSQDSTLWLLLLEPLESATYTVDIKIFEDYYRQFTEKESMEVSLEDMSPPKELYFTGLNVSEEFLEVSFSEEVDESALNIENYELTPFGKIESINEGNSDNKIEIYLSGVQEDALGVEYTLKGFSEIKAESGRNLTEGAGSVLQFAFFKEELNNVFVYPQPIKLRKDEQAVFANLTSSATVEIYNEQGELLRSVREFDGNGGVEWDLTNSSGEILPPGVYYYKVEGENTPNERKLSGINKFMITP